MPSHSFVQLPNQRKPSPVYREALLPEQLYHLAGSDTDAVNRWDFIAACKSRPMHAWLIVAELPDRPGPCWARKSRGATSGLSAVFNINIQLHSLIVWSHLFLLWRSNIAVLAGRAVGPRPHQRLKLSQLNCLRGPIG